MRVFESNFTEKELSPLINIIKKGEIGFGSNVSILENKFKKYSNCKYNIATNSASASSFIIFSYLKNKYGDWILYDPGFSKNTYFLWLLPILMFVFGGAIILRKVILKKKKL